MKHTCQLGGRCEQCKISITKRFENRIKKGLCGRCGVSRYEKGKRHCINCLWRSQLTNFSATEQIVAKQAIKDFDGRCQSCGRKHSGSKKRNWHLDHNHKTGEFRGILCCHCNLALGHSHDNAQILKKLIKYLER